jgi:hypothetical protein
VVTALNDSSDPALQYSFLSRVAIALKERFAFAVGRPMIRSEITLVACVLLSFEPRRCTFSVVNGARKLYVRREGRESQSLDVGQMHGPVSPIGRKGSDPRQDKTRQDKTRRNTTRRDKINQKEKRRDKKKRSDPA